MQVIQPQALDIYTEPHRSICNTATRIRYIQSLIGVYVIEPQGFFIYIEPHWSGGNTATRIRIQEEPHQSVCNTATRIIYIYRASPECKQYSR